MILFWAWGCSAETLKVQLPPKGIHSIGSEDLQRDVWSQLNPESGFDTNEWLAFRYGQHDATVSIFATGEHCAAQSKPITWLTVKPKHPSHTPYWTAIMLSAAKGLEPEQSGGFCVGEAPEVPDGLDLSDALQFDDGLSMEDWQPDSIHYELVAEELQGFLKGL